MKSFVATVNNTQKTWYYVDATNKILGRFAARIAHYLKGKHKVQYTPHVDTGDFIVVINAEKIIVTGNKKLNKIYYQHTGYIGGIKKISFQDLLLQNPSKILKIAVKGMLPKGPLGRVMLKKLKVYAHNLHEHNAQKPTLLNI
ncbi:50S ribosomal protein L13 [Buchnera aphidicola (Takecallis arundicolens)]|uniref:50S ribosomal protein L13 n=1 Tax=Buchnera aphidicola TaxID=9 RepID=UPI003464D3CB